MGNDGHRHSLEADLAEVFTAPGYATLTAFCVDWSLRTTRMMAPASTAPSMGLAQQTSKWCCQSSRKYRSAKALEGSMDGTVATVINTMRVALTQSLYGPSSLYRRATRVQRQLAVVCRAKSQAGRGVPGGRRWSCMLVGAAQCTMEVATMAPMNWAATNAVPRVSEISPATTFPTDTVTLRWLPVGQARNTISVKVDRRSR
mmetsp:Transcript_26830/g.48223  ORF Transcript_26830/g.48223 Transcript_26830/m.48223 type:complete len:202 (+) Transcript_26830:380-985(+)